MVLKHGDLWNRIKIPRDKFCATMTTFCFESLRVLCIRILKRGYRKTMVLVQLLLQHLGLKYQNELQLCLQFLAKEENYSSANSDKYQWMVLCYIPKIPVLIGRVP
jgi:hypothetical protein